MPASWAVLLQERLVDEERSLAELIRHGVRLDSEYETTRRTYEDAARALQVVLEERVRMAERQDWLRRSIYEMQARLDEERLTRRPMQTMPAELLRSVFLDLSRSYEPDELWELRGRFNPERAKMPFVLSAVSRRFREVARDCPELWTYAGVPPLPVYRRRWKPGHAHLRRVKTILELSKNMSIDVLLPWSMEVPWSSENEWHRRIVDSLSAHAHRFRRVHARFPQQGDLDLPLGIFCRSMPMLEQLTVTASSNNDVSWNPADKFLTFCPRLRELRSEYSNVVFTSPCAVTSLTLRVTIPCDHIWEMLRLASSTVEHLDVGIQWLEPNFVVDPPKRMLTFRALKSLKIAHYFSRMLGPWAGLISVPVLENLEFDISTLGLLHRFLAQQCARTLRALILTAGINTSLTAEHAAQLLNLENIEDVSITCVVHETFVHALVDGTWPRLKRFALVDASVILPRNSDALPRLVRARNLTTAPEGSQLTKLETVIMGVGTVEEWVRAEVHFLLGEDQEDSDGEPWGGEFENEDEDDEDEDEDGLELSD